MDWSAILCMYWRSLSVQLGVITAFTFFRTRLHPNSIEYGNMYFSVVFFSLVSLLQTLECHKLALVVLIHIVQLFFKQAIHDVGYVSLVCKQSICRRKMVTENWKSGSNLRCGCESPTNCSKCLSTLCRMLLSKNMFSARKCSYQRMCSAEWFEVWRGFLLLWCIMYSWHIRSLVLPFVNLYIITYQRAFSLSHSLLYYLSWGPLIETRYWM